MIKENGLKSQNKKNFEKGGLCGNSAGDRFIMVIVSIYLSIFNWVQYTISIVYQGHIYILYLYI